MKAEATTPTFDDKARRDLLNQARWAKEAGAPVNIEAALAEIDRLKAENDRLVNAAMEATNAEMDAARDAADYTPEIPNALDYQRLQLAKRLLNLKSKGLTISKRKGAFMVFVAGCPIGMIYNEYDLEQFLRRAAEPLT